MESEVSKILDCCCVGLLFVLLVFSTFASAQLQDGSLRSMRLLNAETGWALTDRLFWTTDGGSHWKDITPHGTSHQITAVFFLDTSTGWMLLARTTDSDDAVLGFDLAATVDSGANWIITPVRISGNTDFSTWGNSARLDFVDPLHGWILFSAGARGGSLVATEDGGKNWHNVSASGLSEEGVYGPMEFLNTRDGWFTNGYWLYRTQDGGNTWNEISLKAPPEASPATRPAYDIPTFRDNKHGILPVTYSIAYSVPEPYSAFVLFTTEDGGQAWKAHQVVSNLKSMAPGTTFPSSVTDSILIAATSRDGRHLTLMNDTTGTSGDVGRTVSQLSFADIARGWAMTTEGYLFSTNDAGATWTDITPEPKGHSTTYQTTVAPQTFLKALDTFLTVSGTASVSKHLGFEQFSVAPIKPNLETWWKDSPYFDLGFYLNGAFTHSSQDPLLSSSWVSGARNQGWGLWPHWEDYQAPCDSYTHKINPASANNFAATRAQGKESADCAALSAGGITLEGTGACKRPTCTGNACSTGIVPTKGLGLAGHIIYYDLEGYNPAALVTDPTTKLQIACGAPVNAFLDAWITEIKAKGFLAGVYSNLDPAASWHKGGSTYSAVSPLPDDVEIAAYIGPQSTIWGLGRTGTSPGLSDTYWKTNQRIHQYTNTHPETWPKSPPPGVASYKLSIDNDIEDAQIVGGSGTKTYNFTFKSFDCSSTYTQPYAINDLQVIVGSYRTSAGLDQGFIYNGTCHPVTSSAGETHLYGINNAGQYVGTMAGHGYLFVSGSTPKPILCHGFSTVPQAINDDGQVVGYYDDSSGIEHGFLWTPTNNGTCTTIDDGTFQTDIFGLTGFTDVLGMYEVRGGSCPAGLGTSACYYGFLKNAVTGQLTSVPFPSGNSNCGPPTVNPPNLPPPCYWVQRVNNNMEMVGYWTDFSANRAHGFLFPNAGGHFVSVDCPSLDCPNVTNTYAYGINAASQIVGNWNDSNFHTHGFIATRVP